MSDHNPTTLCESVQEFWLHDDRGADDACALSKADASAHLLDCSSCRDAVQADRALRQSVNEWNAEITDVSASRPGADQRLERHLVRLVQEDVERRFEESSMRSRLRSRSRSFLRTWSGLIETSPVFRTLTAAALILALLLVGFVALDLSGRPADLGAQDDWLPKVDEPVQKRFGVQPMGARDLKRRTDLLPRSPSDQRVGTRKK